MIHTSNLNKSSVCYVTYLYKNAPRITTDKENALKRGKRKEAVISHHLQLVNTSRINN